MGSSRQIRAAKRKDTGPGGSELAVSHETPSGDEPALIKVGLELDNHRRVTQPTGLVVTNNRILPEAPLRGASDAFFLFA